MKLIKARMGEASVCYTEQIYVIALTEKRVFGSHTLQS